MILHEQGPVIGLAHTEPVCAKPILNNKNTL